MECIINRVIFVEGIIYPLARLPLVILLLIIGLMFPSEARSQGEAMGSLGESVIKGGIGVSLSIVAGIGINVLIF